MSAFWLGTLGYIMYFLYDVNSILWKNKWMQKLFGCGTLTLFAGTMLAMIRYGTPIENLLQKICIFTAIVFFLLLIYSLFFALSFSETYRKNELGRNAYTNGVYALCRHPGVLWLGGLYLSLWGITGNFSGGFFFLAMIWYDFLYIMVQDFWTFPHTFCNYEAYRTSTPFLLPTPASIRKCIRTIGK